MRRKHSWGEPMESKLELDEFQKECIAVFRRAAAAVSLPKSMGEIYGLLFSTPEPLNLDQMVERLKASRGGTFGSLRMLRDLGMVTGGIYIPPLRREHFQAERNLRKLAAAFISAHIEPHVKNGGAHLQRLQASVAPEGAPQSEFQRQRIEQIERWHRFVSDILPFIRTFAEKF